MAVTTPRTSSAGDEAALIAANLSDLYRAFSVPSALQPVAKPLLQPYAKRFAAELLACDRRVAELGLQAAMRETLAAFGVTLKTLGAEHIPATGPVLVAANHPGLADAPALLASLARPDLSIVGAERDLLRSLPRICERLILVDRAQPRSSVTRVVRQLRAGGAVLTFPAGQIEPDPALAAGAAAASLAHWSRSVELFVKLEPRTQVVPAIVAGVVHPETPQHPLTALHREPEGKAWLAASLQVMLQRYRHTQVSVCYGSALTQSGAATVGGLAAALRQQSAQLIKTCLQP